jgi:hypothetical protein
LRARRSCRNEKQQVDADDRDDRPGERAHAGARAAVLCEEGQRRRRPEDQHEEVDELRDELDGWPDGLESESAD